LISEVEVVDGAEKGIDDGSDFNRLNTRYIEKIITAKASIPNIEKTVLNLGLR
jgi:hypothetical protein